MLSLSTALRSEISRQRGGNHTGNIELWGPGSRTGIPRHRIHAQRDSPLRQETGHPRQQHPQYHAPSGWNVPRHGQRGVRLSPSPDRGEREMAVKYTRRTLEWAEETGAQAVVLHLGKVGMDSPMRTLKNLYDQKKIQTDEGKVFVEERMKIRAREGRKIPDGGPAKPQKLAADAEKMRLFLGIENRYNMQDFPNVEEFKSIFKELKGSSVRYWHDLGHATTQENLGMVAPGELLDLFGRHLIGVHLHGCRGYDDHAAPGTGEEDYSQLKKFLQADTIKVVETHHRATREELRKGLEFLRDQGIG